MWDKINKHFILPYFRVEKRKWVRVIDAIIPLICLTGAGAELILLAFQPDQYFALFKKVVLITYLLTLIPIAYLLYRSSELILLERHAIKLFVLASGMGFVLFSI
jgi:lipoprotein signal peptidase